MYFYERAKYPEIKVSAVYPLAQACLESGNFASGVFNKFNNCLGMKAPNKRPTTCTNKGQGGYANYDSVMDGIEDYVLFLKEWNLTTDQALWEHLAAGKYAEDKQYPTKISGLVASLKASDSYLDYPTVVTLATGGLLGLGAAGYVAYDKFLADK
jgi:flagellum-specific peptidoglycan hydrolase FlgJ